MPKVIGNRSALELALAELHPVGLTDREFTLNDFIAEGKKAGKSMSERAARETLTRMTREGKLSMRRVIVNGKLANAYSAP